MNQAHKERFEDKLRELRRRSSMNDVAILRSYCPDSRCEMNEVDLRFKLANPNPKLPVYPFCRAPLTITKLTSALTPNVYAGYRQRGRRR